jgi:hypothetical protein
MLSFILGAIAGGVAATYWQADLNRVRTERLSQWRERLADHVETTERTVVKQVGALSTRARDLLRSQPAGDDAGRPPRPRGAAQSG